MGKRVIIDGKYEQQSYCDSFISRENGVTIGDVRVIDEKLYYAFAIYPKRFRADKVLWTNVRKRWIDALD